MENVIYFVLYFRNTWSLQFLCMNLAPHISRSVLIGTNTGCVVHCILSKEQAPIAVYSNKDETDCKFNINIFIMILVNTKKSLRM